MHNAAFAALGLDWAYVALPTPPERLEDAVRGLAALGFAGANVTTPHKLAVTALCETDAPSVNTLVVRDGRDRRPQRPTPRSSPASRRSAPSSSATAASRVGVPAGAPARAPVLAARRLAARSSPAPTSSSTRPRNETRSLVELGPGQTLVDLPYPETATAPGGATRGATSSPASRCSSPRARPRSSSGPG